MKKRIVIFGSKGFVSSALIKKLKSENQDIVVLGSKKYNLLLKKNIKKINKIIKDNDSIFFSSALAPCKNFKDFQKNLDMSLNILKSLKNKKIKKFIYLSSDAVYSDTRLYITEDSKVEPNNIHGLMHICREKVFKNYFGNKILILRPTLIYGETDTHNSYGPNSFIRLAIKNKNIKLFGKGEEKRDHIYINDVVRIIYLLIKGDKCGSFNICTGKVFSFYNIAKIIIAITNSKSKIIFTKRTGKPHHLGLRKFDITKLKNNIKNLKISSLKQELDNKIHVKYKKINL